MMPEINETETPEPVLLQPVVMRRRFVALMGEPGDNVYQKEWDALYAIWESAWNQSRRLALLDAASEVAPFKGSGGILSGTSDLTTPSHAAATVRPAGPVTLHRSADGEVYFITPGRTL